MFESLQSRSKGLTAEEAAERLRELVKNTLGAPVRVRLIRSLFRQLTNFFSLLLDVAAGLCFVANAMQPGERMDVLGWALLGVSLLNFRLVAHSYLFLGLIEAAYSLFLFFWVLHAGGWRYGDRLTAADPLYQSATGLALATITLMQIGNFIGRRSATRSGLDRGLFTNRLILIGFAIEILFSWGALYFPPLCRVLGTGPVSLPMFAMAWLGAPLIFAADYLRKRMVATTA